MEFREQLSGIENAAWIEDGLDPPHQREFQRGFNGFERRRFHAANPMFGANGAAIPKHNAMNEGGHLVPSGQECILIRAPAAAIC